LNAAKFILGIRLEHGGPRFDSRVLPPAEALAAGATSLELGQAGLMNIVRLASYPLLLPDTGYSIRRLFDAACRLADVEPNILLESRAPHTLLALAEVGQGVAIIPSLQRTDRYDLQIVRVTHRRKPIQERVAVQWDKRRPLPGYAQSFCEALVDYMRDVLPITHPTESRRRTREQSPIRKSRKREPIQVIGESSRAGRPMISNVSKITAEPWFAAPISLRVCGVPVDQVVRVLTRQCCFTPDLLFANFSADAEACLMANDSRGPLPVKVEAASR
jgi:LysR substrate binding domain-containing protein